MAATLEPSDRWLAAAAHLGVPCYSALLPLGIWAVATKRPFVRDHADQAFVFQCLFLAAWVVLVILMAVGVAPPLFLVGVFSAALVLEMPQIVMALSGRHPVRFIPLRILPR